MAETVLTFRYLRELQKAEKESNILQSIDTDFYNLVEEYLKRKMKISEKDAMKSFGKQREIENVKSVIKDIFNRRENKILNGAIKSVRGDIQIKNMLPEEEGLLNNVTKLLKTERKSIDNILNAKNIVEKEPSKEIKKLKVNVLSNIPAFVAEDLETYGPWKEGDVVEVSVKAGETLIKTGKAEKVT